MIENPPRANRQRLSIELQERVDQALARALAEDWVNRIWTRDPSVWSDDEHTAELIANRLGWLDLPLSFHDRTTELEAFALALRQEGFTAAVVCGMGGSSLAPEVLQLSLPLGETGILVRVLDSTDPIAVRAASTASDPAGTLYLIASKSGTTTETLAFLAHFWQLEDDIHADIPQGLAGEHFVAITDPGKSLHAIPHSDLFREVFLNPEDVGGRYSALSYVGLVPAALMGLDLRALLDDAADMADRCRILDQSNPGLWLGAALGSLAAGPRQADAGHRAAHGARSARGSSSSSPRAPASTAWASCPSRASRSATRASTATTASSSASVPAPTPTGSGRHDRALDARSAEAGHPVIDLSMLGGDGALGAEFFRWEFATAVAGAVLGINPFDEPNVTESKDNTKRVLEEFRETGALPAEEVLATPRAPDACRRRPAAPDGEENRRHGNRAAPAPGARPVARLLRAPGVHRARRAERDAALRGIATLLRDRTGRAVTVGYGPRFLHSTGQLHKGGAPTGCFIQLTANHPNDLEIPGWHETFGTLIDAQAAGDFISLESHDLPVPRINLSANDLGRRAWPRCARRWRSAGHAEPTAERTGPPTRSGEWSWRSSVSAAWAATWPAGCTRPVIRVVAYNRSRDKTERDHRRRPRGRLHAGRRSRQCSLRRASSG